MCSRWFFVIFFVFIREGIRLANFTIRLIEIFSRESFKKHLTEFATLAQYLLIIPIHKD